MKTRIKRNSLLLVLTLFVCGLSCNVGRLHAQTWPMPGATWEYCITGWNGMPAGHLVMGIKGDTVIQNCIYTIIGEISGSKSVEYSGNQLFYTLFTRYSNDTVYRFVNNREYFYFNFNTRTSDVYSTFRSAGNYYNWSDSACTSILPVKTISTDTISLNGMQLRRSILRDTLFKILYNAPDEEEVEYTLVERIGIINGLPLINSREPAGNGDDCSLPSDYVTYTLGSYYDDSFFAVQFITCEGVGINDESNDDGRIHAYPIPANDQIVFEVYNALNSDTIAIIDLTGRSVATLPLTGEKTVWDTREVMPGIYLYRLQTLKGSASGKLIIKH